MASPPPNLQEIHSTLYALAIRVGQMITSASPTTSNSTFTTKKNSSDLVTETDRLVEDVISSTLHQEYPSYAFLGEETSATTSTLTSSPTFIVDPIDGTTNFVHAHPYISISLAFVYDFIPCVGIVYNPFTQHLYHAVRGQGAFLTCPSLPTSAPPLPSGPNAGMENVEPVIAAYTTTRLPLRAPAPPLEGLRTALVAVEWGNERAGNNWEVKTRTFANLAGEEGGMVHSLRSLGSAALNCCAVARGDLDAYWEGGCWAWDVAAGWCVVEEAGGRVVGGNEGEWDGKVDGRRYLVVRGAEGGQEEFVREFWGRVGGKLEY